MTHLALIRRGTLALAIAATIIAGTAFQAASASPPSRSFDTNGDGKVDLTIYDTNDDGFFEWPAGTTNLPGRLDFTSTDRIAFSGTTTIKTANGLFYDAGSQLVTLPGAPLTKLVVTATRGRIFGYGLLDLTTTLDLSITAYNEVFLFGATHLTVGRTATLSVVNGDVGIAQQTPDDFAPGAFAVLAGKQLNLTAKGARGSILIQEVRVGSRAVVMSAKSSSSTAPGFYVLRDHALVTTDPARTGLVGAAGNVTLIRQKDLLLVQNESIIDSGKDIVFRVEYGGTLCVKGGSAVDANNGAGTIDTRAVSDGAFRDATSTITGNVVGKPFVEGC